MSPSAVDAIDVANGNYRPGLGFGSVRSLGALNWKDSEDERALQGAEVITAALKFKGNPLALHIMPGQSLQYKCIIPVNVIRGSRKSSWMNIREKPSPTGPSFKCFQTPNSRRQASTVPSCIEGSGPQTFRLLPPPPVEM